MIAYAVGMSWGAKIICCLVKEVEVVKRSSEEYKRLFREGKLV